MRGVITQHAITEPLEGLQVAYYSHIYGKWFVGRITNPAFANSPHLCQIDWGNELTNYSVGELKNLANLIQFRVSYNTKDGNCFTQTPIRDSDWQTLLDRKFLLGSIVSFKLIKSARKEILTKNRQLAKIVFPPLPKLYTEEEIDKMLIDFHNFVLQHKRQYLPAGEYVKQFKATQP